MNLNEREVATVLAALRYWKERTYFSDRRYHTRFDDDFPHFNDTNTPLNDDEIDDMCERINTCES